jgi:hypothetical protein
MIGSTEHHEQMGFVTWFRGKFSGVVLIAIPNGGARHIKTAVALKQEGVVAGTPDMFIPAWSLWLEMKRCRGGVVSKEQEKMFEYLRGIGHTVILGRGSTDMSRQVLDFADKIKYKEIQRE